MPEQRASGEVVEARVVALAGGLRARGVAVGSGEVATAVRALAAVDPGARTEARAALRCVLTRGPGDRAAFDAAFADVFGEHADGGAGAPLDVDGTAALALPRAAVPDAPSQEHSRPQDVPIPAAWSAVELLHEKDFADYTDAERAAARAVLRDLARRGPRRPGRRTRPARRGAGTRLDVARTLRGALRTGGEPLRPVRRRAVDAPRALVLVVDVSGSMAPYARMLLQYAQAAVAARRRVEVFAFGTRLTRLTLELRDRDPERALRRAAAAVEDWTGGTRIGAAIGELNRVHGRRLGRGAVVVVLSDGWDRGEPELLAAEMERLRRSAHRVVWLNPLKASPGYAPLARGMAAALPHTDHFLAGHALSSLTELAVLLEDGIDGRGADVPRRARPPAATRAPQASTTTNAGEGQ